MPEGSDGVVPRSEDSFPRGKLHCWADGEWEFYVVAGLNFVLIAIIVIGVLRST